MMICATTSYFVDSSAFQNCPQKNTGSCCATTLYAPGLVGAGPRSTSPDPLLGLNVGPSMHPACVCPAKPTAAKRMQLWQGSESDQLALIFTSAPGATTARVVWTPLS